MARWMRPRALLVVTLVGTVGCGPESATTADASTDGTSASATASTSTSTSAESASATADDSGTVDTTATDATDTDAPPSGGVRVLYVKGDERRGEVVFLSTFEDGIASAPFAIGDPIPNRELSGLASSPGGTAVKVDVLDSDLDRDLFMPVDDGIPTAPVDSGVVPASADVRLFEFAPDGSGALLAATDAPVRAFHHLPFDGGAIGAPVALGPSLQDQGIPREARYLGSDRVLLTIDTDPDVEGRELFVVALDDPQTLNLVDPDAQNVFGITSDDAIIYSHADDHSLFAAQLDGVAVAAMARIDDPTLQEIGNASTSPNTRVVAYRAGDPKALYVVALDGVIPGPSSVAVPADYGPHGFPWWSPDGAWLLCPLETDWGLVYVADGVPGEVLVVPSAEHVFSADSSMLYVVPRQNSDFDDLLTVALDGDAAAAPYALADAATYGEFTLALGSPAGELMFVAGEVAAGQSLWYFAAPMEGADPVELTGAPVPQAAIDIALFTYDGAAVVMNRGGHLYAIELARPGVEIEIAGPGVGSMLLLP